MEAVASPAILAAIHPQWVSVRYTTAAIFKIAVDGAVMMVGAGGDSCKRADHGIGVTEAGDARLGHYKNRGYRDFGDVCNTRTSYFLSLWIK